MVQNMSIFLSDLKDASVEAANFLRDKSKRLNKKKDLEELYSGEREFVAECYRRLVEKNEEYLLQLLIEYYKPARSEKSPSLVYPDLAFYSTDGSKTAVEVKPVWFLPTRIDDLYKADKDRISSDYKKLRDKYTKFDSKILLVPFLGDEVEYKRNKLRKYVESLVHKNSAIDIITC